MDCPPEGKPQLQRVDLRISNGSLASQAVGPPLSQLEMSWEGRSWADVGKKMLSLRPLALQKVDPNDSVMGALAKDAFGVPLATGLNTTYSALIQLAFQEQWWANNSQIITQTSV